MVIWPIAAKMPIISRQKKFQPVGNTKTGSIKGIETTVLNVQKNITTVTESTLSDK